MRNPTVPSVNGARRVFAAVAVVAAIAAPTVAATPAFATPRVVAITAASHPGFDRVVFRFTGGLPASREGLYVPQLIEDGSGNVKPIAGRRILQIRLHDAEAHDAAGNPSAPLAATFALPNVMQVVSAGDFEGIVTYGIGLTARTGFHLFTLRNPARVVVDISTNFRRAQRTVYLTDVNRLAAGTPPYEVGVQRTVAVVAPAASVLHRMYAGPTPAEAAAGLRLVASESTGFADLAIAAGVARVRLVGGCSSGGSTYTVANLLLANLLPFPNVDAVKVFDPQGATEVPGGASNSIPACLEP